MSLRLIRKGEGERKRDRKKRKEEERKKWLNIVQTSGI